MKLSGRDALAWIAGPRAGAAATLLHGSDAMRVALKRKALLAAITGPDGDAEMRLTRLGPEDLKSDRAVLSDALRAQGFFPGPRAVFLDGATHHQTPAITAALGDWQDGDAHLVVTTTPQKATSALLKAFVAHKSAAAIAVYDDPPDRDEIRTILTTAGLNDIPAEPMGALDQLARTLPPGDFRQLAEKLALYKRGDRTPLGLADISACAPASAEADLDQILDVVAGARPDEIGPVMQRLKDQGMQPVTLCIGAMRHFRTLHAAASGGPLRAPYPRQDAMRKQAQHWGAARLEQALRLLVETDLSLRSTARAPQMAVMERALIRLSMMARR